MPHRNGDPIPRMSKNQRRVYEAYGSIPIWLDEHGSIVCQYCNMGAEGCAKSCLLAGVMNSMRNDVNFLDLEDARSGSAVTPGEIKDNFRKFCDRPDVSSVVSGERLFDDFINRHKIIQTLQALETWLKLEGKRYADMGGVQNQPKERLALKCERALLLFLRLDLNALGREDTIILSNIIESSGIVDSFDPVMQNSIQNILDLVSITHAFKEMEGREGGIRKLLREAPEFKDDPKGPQRCHGKTQSGARCKLTEDSINRLHGKCAEAAKPLARGSKYCKFHCSQDMP